jgi:hypothetical protein
LIFSVAATFEMASTYVFAGGLIRNADAGRSTPPSRRYLFIGLYPIEKSSNVIKA